MDAGLSGLVLAGGAARRLGGGKAGRRVGERTLLARALDVAAACCDELILLAGDARLADGGTEAGAGPVADRIARDAAPPPRPVPLARRVSDWPGARGPIGALGAGLEAARHAWCLVLACDMPFYGAREVAALVRARAAAPGALVVAWEGPEPFGALWHRDALPAVRAVHARGGALRDALVRLPVQLVAREAAAGADALLNVNTFADLARARAAARPAS